MTVRKYLNFAVMQKYQNKWTKGASILQARTVLSIFQEWETKVWPFVTDFKGALKIGQNVKKVGLV